MTKRQKFSDKAKTFPTGPGCYLMKNRHKDIIYIGKAKNLRNRVSSYFNNSSKSPKTEIMVSHIRDFDFILTETEAEALVLENTLIKKHTPKYNIMMRDDKSYPYVVVNTNEVFPRPRYDRRPKRNKGIKVYGPFVVGSNISEVLRVITKSFGLRDCSIKEFNSRTRPCLLYQIKQCSAPCVKYIEEGEYDKNLNFALSLFEGKGKKALKEIENQMKKASDKEEFELAAIYRDNLEVLENFVSGSKQKNAEFHDASENLDVVAYHVGEIEVDLSLYMVRNGLLLGHKNFHFPKGDDSEIEENFTSFLHQYYTSSYDSLPEKVVLDVSEDKLTLLDAALKISLDEKVSLEKVSKKYESIHNLTKKNALEGQRMRSSGQESILLGLQKLQSLLNLKERPRILECYDVAIWQGSSPTASKVTFHEGKPDKKNYRYYHLTERPEGNNDFAMMKEMIERRLESGKFPDVMVIDGGKGQLSMALKALREKDLDIPVVALAKEKTDSVSAGVKNSQTLTKKEERIYIPGRSNPYILNKSMDLYRILVRMRDEAHRFSRVLHHKTEKKRVLTSWLDDIPKIGPKTKEKILSNLTMNIQRLKEYSVDEVVDHFSISKEQAENLVEKVRTL